ncbi:MAG: YfhO family protein [Prevotella sp.]|nr:YfhO family protein [Prevotella sp.]
MALNKTKTEQNTPSNIETVATKKFSFSWLYDVAIIALFAVIAFAYFYPADTEGRILYREDASAGRGAGQEASEYLKQTDERTRWTNATFSGMPTYQTAPSYKSTDKLQTAVKAYHLWMPEYVWYVFVYLLGFYILLRAFDFRRALAALGSIIWAFSSYFFIIIAAGHIWKVMALAYLPPMIAGVVLAYRGKYWWGLALTALFTAFEINANHVQMTYYYLFIIVAMVIAFFIMAVRQKKIAQFIKATMVCIVGALIGVCVNLSNLYHTWEYAKESMRGKSELVKPATENQTSSGLERDYITQWSYGIGETWTLLIPNTKGGASVPLAMNEKAMEKAGEFRDIYEQNAQYFPQYWGTQPGTSGPVYVGAFVVFLFILGLFIVKGPMKWALLAVTVLTILLSWGKNFMGLTDFFIDHFPMYAKFRTVASILVVAEFTMPLLAMMALKKIVDEPDVLKRKWRQALVAFVLTGGAALIFAVAPGMFFDFISNEEATFYSQQIPGLAENLVSIRQSIFTADCWRTLAIILIGCAFLWLYMKGKIKTLLMVIALAALCLIDMWTVNKRYLNDEMFDHKSEVRDLPLAKSEADENILKDKSLDYRVLNFCVSTFNDNTTSFYHKSIGGYHAAKLQRYQDLIDRYIAPEMNYIMQGFGQGQVEITSQNESGVPVVQLANTDSMKVLNMLNAKYFIMPMQYGPMAFQNATVMGNAWFVDKLSYVNNANEELDALGKLDLHKEAVADVKFKEILGEAIPQDSTATVMLKSYEPNRLTYQTQSEKGGVIVLSEIYYPEWEAQVDGQPVEVGRVNYTLRALRVPAGQHEIVLSFFPKSVDKTETVAHIALVLLVLSLIGAIVMSILNRRKTIASGSSTEGERCE